MIVSSLRKEEKKTNRKYQNCCHAGQGLSLACDSEAFPANFQDAHHCHYSYKILALHAYTQVPFHSNHNNFPHISFSITHLLLHYLPSSHFHPNTFISCICTTHVLALPSLSSTSCSLHCWELFLLRDTAFKNGSQLQIQPHRPSFWSALYPKAIFTAITSVTFICNISQIGV